MTDEQYRQIGIVTVEAIKNHRGIHRAFSNSKLYGQAINSIIVIGPVEQPKKPKKLSIVHRIINWFKIDSVKLSPIKPIR